MRIAIVVAAGIALYGFSAVAQTPSPATDKSAPAASDRKSAGKRDECRAQAKEKRLRSTERKDFIQVCSLEGRLACLKQAVDQKLTGPARKDFMKSCAG